MTQEKSFVTRAAMIDGVIAGQGGRSVGGSADALVDDGGLDEGGLAEGSLAEGGEGPELILAATKLVFW